MWQALLACQMWPWLYQRLLKEPRLGRLELKVGTGYPARDIWRRQKTLVMTLSKACWLQRGFKHLYIISLRDVHAHPENLLS